MDVHDEFPVVFQYFRAMLKCVRWSNEPNYMQLWSGQSGFGQTLDSSIVGGMYQEVKIMTAHTLYLFMPHSRA